VQRDGKSVVFVIKDDKVAQVAVETGAKIGEMLEIRAGVKPGERVVLRPSEKLHDGTRVAPPAK
jgi:multidrug efflux pump subunit AcrA (membrane-fusion protein)